MSRRGRLAGAGTVAGVVCLLLVAGGGGGRRAEGYNVEYWYVYWPFLTGAYGGGEEIKLQWDPAIWGPGRTIGVTVPDDPRWTESGAFGTMGEVRALVAGALRFWSEVPTADVRWRLQGPAEEGVGAITVTLEEDFGAAAWAVRHFEGVNELNFGLPNLVGCGIEIDARGVLTWPLDRSSLRHYKSGLSELIAHELGHCLGLDHPPAYPNARFHPAPFYEQNSMWGEEPVMAPGGPARNFGSLEIPTSDRIGASLVRPAPGWMETTGAVYGTVISHNRSTWMRPTILVARIGVDGVLRDVINKWVDRFGAFLIEGLAPGNYVVLVGHKNQGSGSKESIRDWDSVLLSPVEVRAGERTGPLVLSTRGPTSGAGDQAAAEARSGRE